MPNNDLIDLLGKHINEVPKAYTDTTTIDRKEDVYTLDITDHYFNKPYEMVFLSVDDNLIIKQISFAVNETIDQSLYQSMVSAYGEPNIMLKFGELISIDPTVTQNDWFKIENTLTYNIEKCTFDESPFVFGWHKENYDIQVLITDQKNQRPRTLIVFGKGILDEYKKF
ncbi:hypothetical protein AWE51_22045 [Aquimarina aggregata]|uniref:Uncharacterized protein n=1 Tax=Aquimarina aggregata TaxID=1642818 RepID=A0A162DJI4_9FLAO|nr:hypothetical protein [Aquimarina aggregata]KZS41388.1 hypothetical protein AWE51_22045 [Aquimarina aggregata]